MKILPRAELTELDLVILTTLKRWRSATADEIRRDLPMPVDALTVRAALLRLEERGCIAHRIEPGRILYLPLRPNGLQDTPVLDTRSVSQDGQIAIIRVTN